jgi:hypothetical protein
VRLPPGVPPPEPTTFTHSDTSLAGLLDGGWTITQATGSEGNFLILNKGQKWMHCELRNAEMNSMRRLSMVTNATSICHGLN